MPHVLYHFRSTILIASIALFFHTMHGLYSTNSTGYINICHSEILVCTTSGSEQTNEPIDAVYSGYDLEHFRPEPSVARLEILKAGRNPKVASTCANRGLFRSYRLQSGQSSELVYSLRFCSLAPFAVKCFLKRYQHGRMRVKDAH
jgi:hypothetical protein